MTPIRHFNSDSHVFGFQIQNGPFLNAIITGFGIVIGQELTLLEQVLFGSRNAGFLRDFIFNGSQDISGIHHDGNFLAVHGSNNDGYLVQIHLQLVAILQSHVFGRYTIGQFFAQLLENLPRGFQSRLLFNLVLDIFRRIPRRNLHRNALPIGQFHHYRHGLGFHIQNGSGLNAILSRGSIVMFQQVPILEQILATGRHTRFVFNVFFNSPNALGGIHHDGNFLAIHGPDRDGDLEGFHLKRVTMTNFLIAHRLRIDKFASLMLQHLLRDGIPRHVFNLLFHIQAGIVRYHINLDLTPVGHFHLDRDFPGFQFQNLMRLDSVKFPIFVVIV
mmetsp:Transcript_12292/g.25468  ORF Transcript_12292/g.25468 Transcript_12292/m.25468 type:complete len:331 (+) Transcript_12292:339-1331(+)